MGTGGAVAKGLRSLTPCNIQGCGGHNARRPCERRDPYAAAPRFKTRWVDDCRITVNVGGYGSLRSQGRRENYLSAFSFSAAFGAKYVKIPSAPARLKASRLSIIARSPSIQPLLAAAAIIAYSPDT